MIHAPYWLSMTLYWIIALGILFASTIYFGVWHPLWSLTLLFLMFGFPKVWQWLFSMYPLPENEGHDGLAPLNPHNLSLAVGIAVIGGAVLAYSYIQDHRENIRAEMKREYLNGNIELTDDQFHDLFGDLVDPNDIKREEKLSE